MQSISRSKDLSNTGAQIKGDPIVISNKFNFSEVLNDKNNSSDENIDSAKTTKALIRLKLKQNQEILQSKLQARLKKAIKTNFSSIKQKEISSRIKHEY